MVLTLWILVSVAVMALSAAALAARHPVVGSGVALAALMLSMAPRTTPLPAQLNLAGQVFSVTDALAFVLLVATALRLLSAGTWPRPIFLVPLAFMLAANAARGLAHFGAGYVLGESLPWLSWITGVAFASTLDTTQAKQVMKTVIAVAVSLSAIASIDIILHGLTPVNMRVLVDNELADPRPIRATGAMLVVEAALITTAWRSQHVWWRISAIVLAGTAVALQHRTIWLVLLVAGGYLILAERGAQRATTVLRRGLTVVLFCAPILYLLGRSETLAASLEETRAPDSTFAWRLASWRALVDQLSGVELVIGRSFGSGFERDIRGHLFIESPHSHYVEMFLRFGLVGITILVLMILHLRQRTRISSITTALLLAQAIYGFAYRFDLVQGLVLGLCMVATGTSESPPTIRAESGSAKPVVFR